ncbi:uncharacterized protein C5orf47 homolog isoform 1-T1 [Hipposideros larvatus]
MAAAGGEREPARFVYVPCFGSHQCGRVLQLGGRRAKGRWSLGLGAGRSQEEPRGAAAAAGAADGGEPTPGSAPAASSAAPASSARSGPRPAARADPHLTTDRLDGAHPELKDYMSTLGLTQKTLAKKFDFPVPLNEASKIMKKKKKVSVWNRVHKLISRMLEENEKYRLRLKCQRLSSENSNYTR